MLLEEEVEYKVGIRDGCLGCSDAQDAFAEYGYLILYKKGNNYYINTPEGENIVTVDDVNYVDEITYLL